MVTLITEDIFPKNETKILTEAGFMAIGRGWYVKAWRIFSGLRLISPQEEHPYIGLGFVLASRGYYKEAIRVIKISPIFEESFFLKAFELLFYFFMKDFAHVCHLYTLKKEENGWGEAETLATSVYENALSSQQKS